MNLGNISQDRMRILTLGDVTSKASSSQSTLEAPGARVRGWAACQVFYKGGGRGNITMGASVSGRPDMKQCGWVLHLGVLDLSTCEHVRSWV